MAGHSQFKNIMHRKGAQDAARAKLFSKLAREITVAAKIGLPDPDMNSRLRLAVQNARAENMPKDNIERAIKKATGGDAENYEEIRYEGYGPGGVAIIVEALTDNRNRTAGDGPLRFHQIRRQPRRDRLGLASCSSGWARSSIRPRPAPPTQVLEAAIEAGADDVESDDDGHIVTCAFEDLGEVAAALEASSASPSRVKVRLAAEARRRRSTRSGRHSS